MRRVDKLKNIEEVNKRLLGEDRKIIKEGYNFNDANTETANKLAGIVMNNYKNELNQLIKSLYDSDGIKKIKEDHNFGSAELGLAIGLVVQKMVMDNI